MVLSQSRNGIKNLKKQIQMGPRFHDKFEKATEELDASVLGLLRVKKNTLYIYRDGSKPWYLVNPKIAGKWMFIPLKIYL